MEKDSKKMVAALLTQAIVAKSESSDFRGDAEMVENAVIETYKSVLSKIDDEKPKSKKVFGF